MLGFNNTGNKHEPIAFITGILAIVCAVLFFLQQFGIIAAFLNISEITYLYIFAAFTLFSGLVLVGTTLGII